MIALRRARALLLLLLGSTAASAQPAAPAPAPGSDKVDAKALMQSGVKLFEAHDYLGALAIFRDAYARFPSAKILLNIGTTLKLLSRNAEAANAYQRYLDSRDTDPKRASDVTAQLADLDRLVGKLDISVTPPDAQLQLSSLPDADWIPAAQAHTIRFEPGPFTIHARRDGYQPDTKSGQLAAGEHASIIIVLAASHPASAASAASAATTSPTSATSPSHATSASFADLGTTTGAAAAPRSRFGAFATVHVSVVPRLGSAWLVGGTADVTEQLAIDAALLLGPGLVSSGDMTTLPPPSFGAYAGASFAFLTGTLRPRVSAGLPMFSSNGWRVAVRAAAGAEYVASRNLSVALDLGAEWALNPENDIHELAIVPALGVTGRL